MHVGCLWFCGLDFESPLPDRTTLVKTRAIWRKHHIFDRIMHHVVDQCITAGLVKLDVHAGVDGTQVRANASIHSLKEKVLAPVQSLEDYLLELEKEDQRAPVDSDDHPNDRRDDDNNHPPASAASKQEKPKMNEFEAYAARENFRGKKFSNRTHRSDTDAVKKRAVWEDQTTTVDHSPFSAGRDPPGVRGVWQCRQRKGAESDFVQRMTFLACKG